MDKQMTPEEYYFMQVEELRKLKVEKLLDLQKELIPEINDLVNMMCLVALPAILAGKNDGHIEKYLVATISMFKLCQYKIQNLTPSEN